MNNCPNCFKMNAKHLENGNFKCLNCGTEFDIEKIEYSNPFSFAGFIRLFRLVIITLNYVIAVKNELK